jgi:hypothetical protein
MPKIKAKTGVNYLELSNEYCSAKIDVIGHHPETIFIEFLSAITISQEEVKELEPCTVIPYLEGIFNETASRIISSNFKALDEQVAPPSLRNDIIIITKSFSDDHNDDFYIKKMQRGGSLNFKFEVYIHSVNALHPNTLDIRFFDDQEMENDAVLSLRDFCDAVMNSPILINNKKFKAEKFVRGGKKS